jgi:hypothetical protein
MTIPSWARVGVKVVCIHPCNHLIKDATYTIVRFDDLIDDELIVVEPYPNTTHAFVAERFRPLVTRTQEQDVRAIKSALRDMPAETRLDRLLELLE